MKLHESACSRALPLRRVLIVASLVCASFLLQAQSAPAPSEPAREVSTTTELQDFNLAPNPTRIVETETQAAGHKLQTRVVEAPSINGGYASIGDTEQETVHVDANTVRVVQRVFGRDPDGRRQLLQVIEEEKTTNASGDERSVRTVSNSDLDGRLQVVRRDVQETASTSPNGKETNTTWFMNTANGFEPVQETHRSEQRDPSGATETRITVLTADGNGGFVPYETREKSETGSSATRTTEERVSSSFGLRFPGDIGDRSSATDIYLVQETVSRNWRDAQGEHKNVQTYFPTIPGVTPGTGMYLAREVSSAQTSTPDGSTQGEQRLQELNLGNPTDGLRVMAQVTEVSRPTGMVQLESAKTIQSWDGNEGLLTVEVVNTQRSTKRH